MYEPLDGVFSEVFFKISILMHSFATYSNLAKILYSLPRFSCTYMDHVLDAFSGSFTELKTDVGRKSGNV